MYTKQQASQLRQEFWTAFGHYMSPLLSSEVEKVNWLNYKTGEKNIHFKMNAGNGAASVSIEITHSDAGVQQLYFEQFVQLKNMLHTALKEDWIWALNTTEEDGRIVSKIYKEITEVNVFNKDDWPPIITFLKPRIIALDEFWNNAKYAFEALRQ